MRFWQQPNVIVFIWMGIGLSAAFDRLHQVIAIGIGISLVVYQIHRSILLCDQSEGWYNTLIRLAGYSWSILGTLATMPKLWSIHYQSDRCSLRITICNGRLYDTYSVVKALGDYYTLVLESFDYKAVGRMWSWSISPWWPINGSNTNTNTILNWCFRVLI